ncbi:hypothetical protein PAPHI01_0037 [Pancytospora philotis]|nr:hypothetical protein PAPHI01_0037 [Pancytospora philotis]
MTCDVSVRVKELGCVQGTVLRVSNSSIYIRDARIGRMATTVVALFKINKQYVLSVERLDEPAFEKFTNEQLAIAARMGNPKYAARIAQVQARRSAAPAAGEPAQAAPAEASRCEKDVPKEEREPADRRAGAARKSRRGDGEWDQFEANSKLFGIAPAFNMDEYAQPINTSNPNYKRDLERSSKIVSDIMSEKTDDMHRLEERGAVKDAGDNDERLYSAASDSSKWDRKEKPCEPRQERREAPKAPAPEPSSEKPESELNKQIKKLGAAIETTQDPTNMWLNVNQLLTMKKQAAAPAEVAPAAPVPAAPAARPRSPTKDAENRTNKGDALKGKLPAGDSAGARSPVSGARPAGDRSAGAGKESPRGPLNNGKDSTPRNGARSVKRGSDSPEPRRTKQVVYGKTLSFKTPEEYVDAVVSKFSESVAPRSAWGTGSSIEEKIDYIKNNQVFILPSEQKLASFPNLGVLRMKK